MKKIKSLIIVLVAVLSLSTNVFAARQIILDRIEGLKINVTFNHRVVTPSQVEGGQPTIEFYPIFLMFYGFPTGEEVKLRISDSLIVGTPQASAFTSKELYQSVKQILGVKVADKIKGIYIQGISEDPSLP